MFNYTHGFYRISSNISPRDIRKMPQIAFAVNHDNGSIFISRSGHGAMMREFNLDRSEYEGGWFWPRQNKIRFVSGLLGGVSGDNQSDVQNAVSAFSGVLFSEEREELVLKCCGSTAPCHGVSTGSTPVRIVWFQSVTVAHFPVEDAARVRPPLESFGNDRYQSSLFS